MFLKKILLLLLAFCLSVSSCEEDPLIPAETQNRLNLVGTWDVRTSSTVNLNDGSPSQTSSGLAARIQLNQDGTAIETSSLTGEATLMWIYQLDPEKVVLTRRVPTIQNVEFSRTFDVVSKSDDQQLWAINNNILDTLGVIIGTNLVEWELNLVE